VGSSATCIALVDGRAGGDTAFLESMRTKLLKHPWPSRVNFLHFPKIAVLGLEALLRAVSMAGAAELSSDFGEQEDVTPQATAMAQSAYAGSMDASGNDGAGLREEEDEADEESDSDESGDTDTEAEEEDGDEDAPEDDETEDEEDEPDTDEGDVVTDASGEEVSNVTMVTPESLGFAKHDVLERPGKTTGTVARAPTREELTDVMAGDDDEEDDTPRLRGKRGFPVSFRLPKFSAASVRRVSGKLSGIRLPRGKFVPVAVGAVVLAVLASVLAYALPRVTITVRVLPQTLEESTTLTVDPTVTIADPSAKTVPGRTLEKSVSGEKTVAVTGTKSIGDPAKGTVMIYNKVTSPRNLSKGTVITGKDLSFTLDEDVSIASASESIGSITFGKAEADVTAKEIGPNGNMPAGTEFTVANISGSQVSARNDAAFTGGTSKQVTVVSRTDQDGLVKALTPDLVDQAKAQLAADATGGDHLIDETIDTEVTDKSFDQEINEEAKSLHGKVTLAVSGISIREDDIKAILTSLITAKVPSGYILSADDTTVSTSKVTVHKDGTISLTAKLSAVALPTVDEVALKKSLAGKDVAAASEILRKQTGIASAGYDFAFSLTKNRLPFNSANIKISVSVQ